MREAKVVTLLILLLIGSTVSSDDFFSPLNPLVTCYDTHGEVVAKENDNGMFILYVSLDYQADIKGYKIFVGPETYEEYEIGYVYTDTTCDIEDYDGIQDIINELLTWGVIEGMSVDS